ERECLVYQRVEAVLSAANQDVARAGVNRLPRGDQRAVQLQGYAQGHLLRRLRFENGVLREAVRALVDGQHLCGVHPVAARLEGRLTVLQANVVGVGEAARLQARSLLAGLVGALLALIVSEG